MLAVLSVGCVDGGDHSYFSSSVQSQGAFPSGSTITTNTGKKFTFRKSTETNALQITSRNQNGTLTLETPNIFSKIAILVTGGGGASKAKVKVIYTDNTESAQNTVTAYDWYSHHSSEVYGSLYRMRIGVAPRGSLDRGSYSGMYETVVSGIDTNKKVKAVQFTWDTSNNSSCVFNVFGLSGVIGADDHIHDDMAFKKWTATDSLPTESGNYRLETDVTISSTWNVPSGTTNICLNGFQIKRTGATGADNSGLAITVGDGANLSVFGPGKVTGGSGFHGGGIHVEGNSSIVLNKCEISGNTGHYGGGLYLKNGTITIKDGTVIKNNSATEGFGGSGIYAEGSGTLILVGGTFTENEIKNRGQYAVFLAGNANVKVSGNPIIYDNKYENEQNNLYLFRTNDQDSIVIVEGTLTDGTNIGIRQRNETAIFKSGWNTYMSGKNPADYFISDNNAYEVRISTNEAYIGPPHTHTWSYLASEDTITAKCTGDGVCELTDQTVKISADDKVYDGQPVTAELTYSEGWAKENGLQIPEISYSGNTDAGDYTASITIDGQTANAEFKISKAQMEGVSVEDCSVSYDSIEHSVSVGIPEGAEIKFGTQEGSYTLEDNPTYTDAGEYTVYYSVTKKNYVTVTGSAKVQISKISAVVTNKPESTRPIYNDSGQPLVSQGTVDGGTLQYALGDNPDNVPNEISFDTEIPIAKNIGSYYVWYRVVADKNHTDISPSYVKVVLADEKWVTFKGVLYQSDESTPISKANITLMKGNEKIDYEITQSDGKYEFTVPTGVYNIVATYQSTKKTEIIEVYEDNKIFDIIMPDGKTESLLTVNSNDRRS